MLSSESKATYAQALASVRAGIRGWFESFVSGEYEPDDQHQYQANAEELKRFLKKEALPWLESRIASAENRHLIREQAYGDSLNVDALEKLARYEVHLDRKLEKMLGMLYRLKELTANSAESVSQNHTDGA